MTQPSGKPNLKRLRFEYRGLKVQVKLVQRPFREGLQAHVSAGTLEFTLAELGLGEAALRQRIEAEIERLLAG